MMLNSIMIGSEASTPKTGDLSATALKAIG